MNKLYAGIAGAIIALILGLYAGLHHYIAKLERADDEINRLKLNDTTGSEEQQTEADKKALDEAEKVK